jgi:hypothetical protein
MGPEAPGRADIEEIRKAADQAASLTRQLLSFTRKQAPCRVSMDLNQTVKTVVQMLRRLIGEDIELAVSLENDLGPLKADPGQMAQVLINIALNARDAMPHGGRLSITTANSLPSRELLQRHPGLKPGPAVVLSVGDTGSGMSAQVLQHLFEPFFTTKDSGRGTGLGLSSALDIVKQHGGEIVVESQLGQGSRFDVFLPQSATQEKPAPATAPAARRTASGVETVLLVEDDEMVLELSRRMLQAGGYRVLAARSAPEAERCLCETGCAVDLLVADVVLPGLNGRELALRLTARMPGLRVLFVSGYSDDTLSQHGVLEPGGALLSKPFSLEEFAAKVREILDSAPPPR